MHERLRQQLQFFSGAFDRTVQPQREGRRTKWLALWPLPSLRQDLSGNNFDLRNQ
jgi:hypothetical protein